MFPALKIFIFFVKRISREFSNIFLNLVSCSWSFEQKSMKKGHVGVLNTLKKTKQDITKNAKYSSLMGQLPEAEPRFWVMFQAFFLYLADVHFYGDQDSLSLQDC